VSRPGRVVPHAGIPPSRPPPVADVAAEAYAAAYALTNVAQQCFGHAHVFRERRFSRRKATRAHATESRHHSVCGHPAPFRIRNPHARFYKVLFCFLSFRRVVNRLCLCAPWAQALSPVSPQIGAQARREPGKRVSFKAESASAAGSPVQLRLERQNLRVRVHRRQSARAGNRCDAWGSGGE
jgi:hypothetical protein